MPRTARIACRRSSLGPAPAASFLNLETSAWLWNERVSTSPSSSATRAPEASSQEERLVVSSRPSTSGQASRMCWSVTGPVGADAGSTGSATAIEAAAAGRVLGTEGARGADERAAAASVAPAAEGGLGADEGAGGAGAVAASTAAGAVAVSAGATAAVDAAGAAPDAGTPVCASTRATMSSSCSRGEVAPVISSRVATTRSAVRDRRSEPNTSAWRIMRERSSAEMPRSTAAAPWPVAAITMRSRSRSSRSSTNRRGS